MKLKNQNQTKPGLKTSSERYHRTTIKPDDIRHLQVKLYDNEPELGPVYEDGRYKVIVNVWTDNSPEDKPNWVLRNKLSKHTTFKNGMYTDTEKPWYVDTVRKAEALEIASTNYTTLHCWLGTTQPRPLRMPCWGASFVFCNDTVAGQLYIHDYDVEFVPEQDWPESYEITDRRTGEVTQARCWEMYNEYEG